ncbi:MAG: hypothetical protein WEC59_03360 [Salibacteraceae bacterium]
MTISIPMLAQDTTAVESFEALQISGQISHNDNGTEDVLVELFEGNKVVDAFETKKNGKFKFSLFSNMIYTIQLSKSGYYTKRISVSTKLPPGNEDFHKFQFDIGMTSIEEANYDPNVSEYPSALISFDEKRREFRYDKDYTKSYFDEIEPEE